MSRVLLAVMLLLLAFPAVAQPWPYTGWYPNTPSYSEHSRGHWEHKYMEGEHERMHMARERHESWCRHHPGVCR